MGKSGNSGQGQGSNRQKSKAKMYYQKQARRGRGGYNNRGRGGWGSGGGDRPGNTAIDIGMKGFLCTTNFKEREAIHEAYNLLNEYYDESVDTNNASGSSKTKESNNGDANSQPATTLSPDETEPAASGGKRLDDDEDEDIESALDQERQELKRTEWRFKSVNTGVKNVVFVKTTIEDPVKLAHRILEDITSKKEQKSRFLLRMVPIEVTCKADVEHISEAAKGLLEKYLKTGCNSYQICYRSRYNGSLKREALIRRLAEDVTRVNALNVVNLNEPTYVIIVEVFKNICCLSVVKDFNKFRKYNIAETTTEPKEKGGNEPSEDPEAKDQELESESNEQEVNDDVAGADNEGDMDSSEHTETAASHEPSSEPANS